MKEFKTTVERGSVNHVLKVWEEFFIEVSQDRKTFEIRKNDRDFRVGDTLELRAFDPKTDDFISDLGPIHREVTYITDWGQLDNQVVLALGYPT